MIYGRPQPNISSDETNPFTRRPALETAIIALAAEAAAAVGIFFAIGLVLIRIS